MGALSRTVRRRRCFLLKGFRGFLVFRCEYRSRMVTFTSWNNGAKDEPPEFGKDFLQFGGQFAIVAKIDEHVIQQARFAKFRGDQDVGFAVDVCYWLERLGIHNFRVVEFGSGFFVEDAVHGGLQRKSNPGGIFAKLWQTVDYWYPDRHSLTT